VYAFCDADIRLVGSHLSYEGRLEIKVGGVWGTVCDDYFDSRDARVACYMLGYGYVNLVASYREDSTVLTSAGLSQHKENLND